MSPPPNPRTPDRPSADMAEVRWLLLCLLAALCLSPSSPARILGLFPYKGASHFSVIRPLMEELARRGHQVDVVGHLPPARPLANYTHISVKDPDEPTSEFLSINHFEEMEIGFIKNMLNVKFFSGSIKRAHSLPVVKALANVSYDLVFTEMYFTNLFFGLVYKIGAPVIGFSTSHLISLSADPMGVPIDLPYVPNMGGGHGPDMAFFERMLNIIEVWIQRAWFYFVITADTQATAEKELGPLPGLMDIAANTSLLFVNTHHTIFGQCPLPQSVIEIGGIHVGEPQPLPQDLDKLMNDSNGVIYFSMGSILKGSSMSLEKQQMFLNTFLDFGKTVLWKREENLGQNYSNIITRKWFPQRDILAHPKTELFISHCGLLGLYETVASGVPTICFPIFTDQFKNSRHIAASGIGLAIRFATVTEEQIRTAVGEILGNEKYKKRATELSAAFRDRPLSPLDTAVFWTEYLLRHGPRPFTAPFRQMSIWQKLGLDIVLFGFGLLVIIIGTIVFILKALSGRNKKEAKKVKRC